ncbi:hypothetical protein ACEWY4_015989 [Coilia grayii]|uniref:Uncharacterized protein n=1 Tax=Coilia grayii TaxID=363190 RepID=A0ABD1JQH1_9TELE
MFLSLNVFLSLDVFLSLNMFLSLNVFLSLNMFLSLNVFLSLNMFLFLDVFLDLSNNRIAAFPPHLFVHLVDLLQLNISYNPILDLEVDHFDNLHKLKSLVIEGIEIGNIQRRMFEPLRNLTHIYFKKFQYCGYAPHVRSCKPNTDGISSLEDLLANIVLRVFVWVVSATTCFGNVFVICMRSYIRSENKLHAMCIISLCSPHGSPHSSHVSPCAPQPHVATCGPPRPPPALLPCLPLRTPTSCAHLRTPTSCGPPPQPPTALHTPLMSPPAPPNLMWPPADPHLMCPPADPHLMCPPADPHGPPALLPCLPLRPPRTPPMSPPAPPLRSSHVLGRTAGLCLSRPSSRMRPCAVHSPGHGVSCWA